MSNVRFKSLLSNMVRQSFCDISVPAPLADTDIKILLFECNLKVKQFQKHKLRAHRNCPYRVAAAAAAAAVLCAISTVHHVQGEAQDVFWYGEFRSLIRFKDLNYAG
jgi:hypothetical protein